MHELSVSSAIVDTAIRHAGGRQVTAVDARIGALRQVVPSSLGFYFEIVARDTLCDGADLRQHLIAAELRCHACGQAWDPAPKPVHEELPELPTFRCPACWGAESDVLAGNELEVESIEVSDLGAEAGAGGPAPGEPTKAEV
jgi:hydrogenase nickel incorporation protein HypA/HybF